MKNKSIIGVAGVVAGLVFLFFTILVKKDLFTTIDFNITVKIQDKIPKRVDQFLEIFSFLAKGEVIGLILVVFLLLRKKVQDIAVFFFFAVAHIIEFLGKKFVNQPTPPFLFYRAEDLPLFRDYIKPGFSYPSGHTMRAVFISVIFSYAIYSSNKFPKGAKHIFFLSLLFFVFTVSLTKIVLGQHWPTDIVGGALLGLTFACFSLYFFR